MPRERTELIRPSGFLTKGKILILSYEGNDTEPQYYEALKEKLKHKNLVLHIESLKRDKNDTNSAPKHVFKKLKEKKSEYNFKDSDEFWMIIDKDSWKLDEWVEKCKKEKNFFIALSNPCFEFWLLIHILDLNTLTPKELLDISKNNKVNKKRRYVEKLLSDNLADGYKKSNHNPERFLDNINSAILQAEQLDKKDIFKNIGSQNYKLVKKLIE